MHSCPNPYSRWYGYCCRSPFASPRLASSLFPCCLQHSARTEDVTEAYESHPQSRADKGALSWTDPLGLFRKTPGHCESRLGAWMSEMEKERLAMFGTPFHPFHHVISLPSPCLQSQTTHWHWHCGQATIVSMFKKKKKTVAKGSAAIVWWKILNRLDNAKIRIPALWLALDSTSRKGWWVGKRESKRNNQSNE